VKMRDFRRTFGQLETATILSSYNGMQDSCQVYGVTSRHRSCIEVLICLTAKFYCQRLHMVTA
jgi:hypothetical protein